MHNSVYVPDSVSTFVSRAFVLPVRGRDRSVSALEPHVPFLLASGLAPQGCA